MCVVSMIGDGWSRGFPDKYPWYPMDLRATPATIPFAPAIPEVSLAVKQFDEATGQPDCEIDIRVAMIKAVAKAVGVNMDGVFEERQKSPPRKRRVPI